MPLLETFIVPHPPLIIPAVGNGQEHEIEATVHAYRSVAEEIASIRPETIILITPHNVMYADYLHISPGTSAEGDFGSFGAKQVHIGKSYDTELVDELIQLAADRNIPAGSLGERDPSLDHGVLVPLYFVEQVYHTYRIVRISVSGLSQLTHYRFGQCIAEAVNRLDRKAVLIASGDLSHKLLAKGPYGYAPEGPAFDEEVTQAMAKADFMKFLTFEESFTEAAAECGLRGFVIMAGALDGQSVSGKVLSYEGPFGVGYGVAKFRILGEDASRQFGEHYRQIIADRITRIRNNEDEYVRLARMTLETYVRTGRVPSRPSNLPSEMVQDAAGVFVSLKKDGQLRGCIGTISATEDCIADEIIRNAVQAGTEDPRFDPVEESELDSLVYSVDVLGKAEPVNSVRELDANRYGVIVTQGSRRGLLLPNLEGVSTPDEQIEIALRKAGIGSYEQYTIDRFEVVRHT